MIRSSGGETKTPRNKRSVAVKPKLEFNWTTIVALAFVGLIFALLTFTVFAIFFFGRFSKSDARPEVVVKSSGPTITQLQSLGELVVLRSLYQMYFRRKERAIRVHG
jgi:hypothetical protein